jgi:molybdopterin converting factor small subunit
MSTKVKYFGQLTDITGCDTEDMEGTSLHEIIAHACRKHPALGQCSFSTAVGNRIVKSDVNVNSGETVSFLPPFAGG